MRLLPRAPSRCPHQFPWPLPLLLQLFRLVFRFSFWSFHLFHCPESPCDEASIDYERRAGREFRRVGAKVENRRGDFFARADPPDRNDREDLFTQLIAGKTIEHFGSDHSWSNRVDADVL